MPDASGRRCVVFDLDDTLFLERDYVRSGFAAVGGWARRRLGVSGFGERCWAAFEAGARGRTFDEALAACGVEPAAALIDEMIGVYRRHRPSIELLADARGANDAQQAMVQGDLLSNRTKKAVWLGDTSAHPVSASIYQLDGIVRRAPSLQLTADARAARAQEVTA